MQSSPSYLSKQSSIAMQPPKSYPSKVTPLSVEMRLPEAQVLTLKADPEALISLVKERVAQELAKAIIDNWNQYATADVVYNIETDSFSVYVRLNVLAR